jgi:hypothetical protein
VVVHAHKLFANDAVRTQGYRGRARNARSRATPDRDKIAQTSTRYYLTTMAPINDALAVIKALNLGEKLVY